MSAQPAGTRDASLCRKLHKFVGSTHKTLLVDVVWAVLYYLRWLTRTGRVWRLRMSTKIKKHGRCLPLLMCQLLLDIGWFWSMIGQWSDPSLGRPINQPTSSPAERRPSSKDGKLIRGDGARDRNSMTVQNHGRAWGPRSQTRWFNKAGFWLMARG